MRSRNRSGSAGANLFPGNRWGCQSRSRFDSRSLYPLRPWLSPFASSPKLAPPPLRAMRGKTQPRAQPHRIPPNKNSRGGWSGGLGLSSMPAIPPATPHAMLRQIKPMFPHVAHRAKPASPAAATSVAAADATVTGLATANKATAIATAANALRNGYRSSITCPPEFISGIFLAAITIHEAIDVLHHYLCCQMDRHGRKKGDASQIQIGPHPF
jgi:hypothetical protein